MSSIAAYFVFFFLIKDCSDCVSIYQHTKPNIQQERRCGACSFKKYSLPGVPQIAVAYSCLLFSLTRCLNLHFPVKAHLKDSSK